MHGHFGDTVAAAETAEAAAETAGLRSFEISGWWAGGDHQVKRPSLLNFTLGVLV